MPLKCQNIELIHNDLRSNDKKGSHGFFPVAVALLISCLTLVVAFVLLVPHYQTNDDVCFSLITSGAGLTDKPNPHTLFSNIIWGGMFATLSTMAPTVPWYGLSLIVSQFIVSLIVMTIFLQSGPNPARILVCVMYAAVPGLYFFTQLQFTSVAFMLAIAATLVVLRILEFPGPNSLKRTALLIGAFGLFAWSALIRIDSALCVGGLGIAFCACRFCFSSHARKLWKTVAGIVVAMMFIYLVHACNLALFYSPDSGWYKYRACNAACSPLRDYDRFPLLAQQPEKFKSVGWYANDRDVLQKFLYFDTDIFSPEKMRAVATSAVRSDLTVTAVLRALKSVACDPFVGWQLSFIVVLLACLRRRNFSVTRSAILGTVVLMVFLAMIIALKIESRVYVPMICWLFCVIAFYSGDFRALNQDPHPKVKIAAVTAVLFVLSECIALFPEHRRIAQSVQSHHEAFRTAVKCLREHSNRLYLFCSSAMPLEGLLPLESPRDELKSIKLLGSTLFPAPFSLSRLREHNITNVTQGILTGEIYLISRPDLNATLRIFFADHYGALVQFSTVYEYPDNSFGIYRVIPAMKPYLVSPKA